MFTTCGSKLSQPNCTVSTKVEVEDLEYNVTFTPVEFTCTTSTPMFQIFAVVVVERISPVKKVKVFGLPIIFNEFNPEREKV